jgi:hypothetical protein
MSISHRINRAVAGFGVASALLLGALAASSPAAADAVPFTDQNAQGSIGLCDATGHPVQSGSVLTYPFVAAAAPTVPAPAGFGTDVGGHATLYAFQPRQNVDPGEWTGFQLTGSSLYADAQHPLAIATDLDPALSEFLSAYPARWDGLVQLRIYYTAPNRVPYRRTYPAAVLQAKSGHWTVLQGASVKCDLTKAVSGEKLTLPASYFDPAHPAVTHAPGTTPSAAPGTSKVVLPSSAAPRPTAQSSAVPTRSAAAGSASSTATVSEAATKRSSSSAPWIFGVAIIAIGAAGLLVLRSRRRVRS